MADKSIVLYLHVHQPFRVKSYSIFDAAIDHGYFSEPNLRSRHNNQQIFEKVADKSYRPMNELLKKLIKTHPDFKFSLSITGVFLEQAEAWTPDVLQDFKDLVATGRVELVSETYHHSLAFFYNRPEFEAQVKQHQDKLQSVFNSTAEVFRNTELSYNDELAKWADNFGFKGILAEGWDPILEWRSPGYIYQPEGTKNIKLLLKNYRLSDDIAFRFSDKNWPEWPLTVDKYLQWLKGASTKGPLINLFMDYETFGEHQWADTGVFDFFEHLVAKWLSAKPGAKNTRNFLTVSEAINQQKPVAKLSMPYTVTWADTERDLSAWLGNPMQQEALKHIYELEEDVLSTKDTRLIDDWRKLQTSDHFYYMCTKYFNDGDVHAYFSPYRSPYDAFLYYINVLRDLRWRIAAHKKSAKKIKVKSPQK